MSIIIETLHDQYFSLTSEDSLRDSKPRVPEDQGTVMMSQCMKLVLVSLTLIYSATCALLSFHINVCAGVHVLREALVEHTVNPLDSPHTCTKL